jgi:hypothetical protein
VRTVKPRAGFAARRAFDFGPLFHGAKAEGVSGRYSALAPMSRRKCAPSKRMRSTAA